MPSLLQPTSKQRELTQQDLEDIEKYGEITAERPGQSSYDQFMNSLLSHLGPSFGLGEHPVTSAFPAAEAGRKVADLAVPASAFLPGVSAAKMPLRAQALGRLVAPGAAKLAGVGAAGAATAALVGSKPGLPDSNHAPAEKQKPVPLNLRSTYLPEELQSMIGESTPTPAQAEVVSATEPRYSDTEVPNFDQSSLAEQVNPEMLAPAVVEKQAPEDEADSFMKQILSTIEPRGPIQEQPDPESVADLKELTKPREGVKQAEPTSRLGKIGRGINKFLVAGSGPYDPTRYDRQQLELEQKRQQFTPQEALRGDLAVAERTGRQAFNRQSQLQNANTGGMTDLDKTRASVVGGRLGKREDQRFEREKIGLEGQQRMREIAASAASQKLSPEAEQRRAQREIADKYLYAFSPEEIKRQFGLDISQAGLDAVKVAAQKDNPMAIAVAQLLQQRMQAMQQPAGKGGKPAPNLSVKALAEGQPVKK